MLDMKRMKKFQRNKADIQKKLSMLKQKIAASDNDEEIVEALQSYQKKLKASMKLNKTDFTGDAKDDFRYGFRMPLRCVNDTNCEWICQNMIRHDGISNKTIESEQNVKIEDLEQDDEQQFESDLVIVDDSADEDVQEEAQEEAGNFTNRTEPARRVLQASDEVVTIVYDQDGYVADDELFVGDLIVDDPAMADTIDVPEDLVDPDTGKTENNSSDDGTPMWVWALAGFATLALVAGVCFVMKNRKDAAEFEQN